MRFGILQAAHCTPDTEPRAALSALGTTELADRAQMSRRSEGRDIQSV
jgi:hypothetical protein